MKTIKKLLLILSLTTMTLSCMSQTNIGNFRRLNVASLLNILPDSLKWEGTTIYKDSLYYTQISGDSCRFKKLGSTTWSAWIGGGTGTTYTLEAEADGNGVWLKIIPLTGARDSVLLEEGQNTLITNPSQDTIHIDAALPTYSLSAEAGTSGAWVKILGTDGTKDSVFLGDNGGIQITRYNDDSIMIQNTVTQITYGLETTADAGGAWVKILGSNGAKDSIFLKKGANIGLSQTSQDTITISSTFGGDTYTLNGAPAWVTSTLYAVGDLVFHDYGNLYAYYLCILQHTSSGAYPDQYDYANWRVVAYVPQASMFIQDSATAGVDPVYWSAEDTMSGSLKAIKAYIDANSGSYWNRSHSPNGTITTKDSTYNLQIDGTFDVYGPTSNFWRNTQFGDTTRMGAITVFSQQAIPATPWAYQDAGILYFDDDSLKFVNQYGNITVMGRGGGGGETYGISSETGAGGSWLKLLGSGGTKDSVKFAAGTNMTSIVRTDGNTITFNAAPATGATYGISAETGTGGAYVKILGSDLSKDSVKLAAGTNMTSIVRTSADIITFNAAPATGATYTLHAKTGTGGAWMNILGSDGSKDSVMIKAGTNITSIVMTNDSTITVNATTQGVSGSVQDINFEFADIVYGTAQTYTLDIKASYGYTINSAVLEVDSGTLTGIAVKINSTAVTSLSSVTATNSATETNASGANTVVAGDRIYIITSTGYTGVPTVLRGKLKITRT